MDWWIGSDEPSADVVVAYAVVKDYRATFRYPLTKVNMGVRSTVETETGGPVIVSQRLKRLPTILDKLGRLPGMDLARMEDIGGCRAILPRSAEVEAVAQRMTDRWAVVRDRDYVTEPRGSGYRARHIVVERDGRRIEIQLRTPRQHEWAVAVERAAARLGIAELKDGRGPDDLVLYFERAAYAIALEEQGRNVDDVFMGEFDALRERVRPYFRR